MNIVIPFEGRVRTCIRSSYILAKRLDINKYTLTGDTFQMTGITPEQILDVLGELTVDKSVTQELDPAEVAKAPGMKYIHYTPQADVIIISGDRVQAADYIRHFFEPGDRVMCFEEELELYRDCAPLAYGREADPESLSAGLFDARRELDDPAIKRIFARCPEGGGIAYAVQNRLKKAAGFHIIRVGGAK